MQAAQTPHRVDRRRRARCRARRPEIVPLPAAGAAGRSSALARRLRGQRRRSVVLPPLIVLGAHRSLVWQLLCSEPGAALPPPTKVVTDAWDFIVDPFYDNGGIDKGAVLAALQVAERVAIGFSSPRWSASRSGVLVGQSTGRCAASIRSSRCCAPCRRWPGCRCRWPASASPQPSALFVIFITSIWPIIINTAVGVRNIPQDYRNVAARHPALVVGVLLEDHPAGRPCPTSSPACASASACSWLAIVAAEMLIGGVGIGFFIWDAWNSSRICRHHRGAGLHRHRRLPARPADRRGRALRHRTASRRSEEPVMDTAAYLKFEQIGMSFRRGQMATEVLRDIDLTHRPGRVRVDDRPFRLRQVDLAQHPRRPAEVDDRRSVPRGQGGRRARPRPRHRLPEPLAAALAHRLRQRRASPSTRCSAVVEEQGRAPRLGDAQSRAGADGAGQGQAPARDLRRHEAARRHRPRARHGAQGAADGRAVRRARRADPRPPAGQRDGDPRAGSATRC